MKPWQGVKHHGNKDGRGFAMDFKSRKIGGDHQYFKVVVKVLIVDAETQELIDSTETDLSEHLDGEVYLTVTGKEIKS